MCPGMAADDRVSLPRYELLPGVSDWVADAVRGFFRRRMTRRFAGCQRTCRHGFNSVLMVDTVR